MVLGASVTAASIGFHSRDGVFTKRVAALAVIFACTFVGAILGGPAVTHTLSGGLLIGGIGYVDALVVIGSAGSVLLLAQLLRTPLSGSEAILGAMVGAGVAIGGLDTHRALHVLAVWCALPLATFIAVAILRKVVVSWLEIRLAASAKNGQIRPVLRRIALCAGCVQAIAAGMNSVASAAGPLAASGILGTGSSVLLCGIVLAAGSLALGGRFLGKNVNPIARVTLLDSSLVALVTGTAVMYASLVGFPVPYAQAALIGLTAVGLAKGGRNFDRRAVNRMWRIWLLSPAASLLLAFGGTRIVHGTLSWREMTGDVALILVSVALLAVQAHSGKLAHRSQKPARAAAR